MDPFFANRLPFVPVAIERKTILQTYLDDLPSMKALHLPIERLSRMGWRDKAVLECYTNACDRLAQWCMRNRRHAHGICTSTDAGQFDTLSAPSNNTHWFADILYRNIIEAMPRLKESAHWASEKWQDARYGKRSPWSEVATKLLPLEPILITACFQIETSGQDCMYLLDRFTEQSGRYSVQVQMTPEGTEDLIRHLGDRRFDIHPCRVLGILRDVDGNLKIQVLRLELALPVFAEIPPEDITANPQALPGIRGLL